MERKIYNPENGPKAVGPYSVAASAGELLFVSGQIPMVPSTGEIKTGASVDAQARQCLENLKTVLAGCGSSLEKVIKCTVFITDMSKFGELNEVYAEYFVSDPPARAVVEVAGLPKNVDVEIEAIALR
ncbi:MAG: 2-iminobutanoate/2-iminopropanoate deaminase [Thermotogaceae bacterium]|jgi:2-iminobutanoate/2-iminopropanoate deaminase|nr:2-iminobutanoate/2-iminopropanoate deaminase [Thermotogaceae bacterium]